MLPLIVKVINSLFLAISSFLIIKKFVDKDNLELKKK